MQFRRVWTICRAELFFFDENGMPKLMNRKMYQICQNLAGRDIQNITELKEALEHPLKENVFYDVDLKYTALRMEVCGNFQRKRLLRQPEIDFSNFLLLKCQNYIGTKCC